MRYVKALAIAERHGKLIRLIRKGMFSAPVLAGKLDVSEQTIYRDIGSLRDRGYPIHARRSADHWLYEMSGNRAEPEEWSSE